LHSLCGGLQFRLQRGQLSISVDEFTAQPITFYSQHTRLLLIVIAPRRSLAHLAG
jgi:hypothetical protein